MLGSLNRKPASHGRMSKPLKGRVYRYGKRAECELCQTVKQCVDRYGMSTCQSCQTEFLPSAEGLVY